MAPPPIAVEELIAINEEIKKRSRGDSAIDYGNMDGLPPSRPRLEAVVSALPDGTPLDQASWIPRALILVQPFADANHRTGIAAVELILRRAGVRFPLTVESAKAFQRAVSGARFRVLGGYDDAALSVLGQPEDEVAAICRAFVEESSAKRP